MNFLVRHGDRIGELIKSESTPFFLYELDALEVHAKKIMQAPFKFWYPLKANGAPFIVKTLDRAGANFDVASLGELEELIRLNIDGQRILCTGPAKDDHFIKRALDYGVQTIVVESHSQLEQINKLAQNRVDVLLRVQLNHEGIEKNILGGNEVTPFGLGFKDWESFLPFELSPHIQLRGFHCFQWGNMLKASELLELIEKTCTEIISFAEKKQLPCDVVDLGGGLGLDYKGEKKFDFDLFCSGMEKLQSKYSSKEFWMELGRYTVGECGVYFNKIIDRKQVRDKNILVMQGGINHLLRPALSGESFPCQSMKSGSKISYQVHGPLCTSLDKLGEYDLPDNLRPGDWLAFHKVGAYGYSESMPFFLAHPTASEFCISKHQILNMRQSIVSLKYMS